MITRRSVLLSSLLVSLGVAVPRDNAQAITAVSGDECAFPIDVIREILGPELLRIGDAPFRAAASRLALQDESDVGSLWADEAWQATMRSDFSEGRVILVHAFVLSYSESVAYAAEALRA